MGQNEERTTRSDRDRRARQADRLARILSVLRLIQSRGKWNAKAIAQELEVTERTVYRDLQSLELAGVPYYFDEDAQSYRVRPDYRFPVPHLTDEETIGQAVAAAISQAPNLNAAGSARKATQRLAAVSSEEVQQLLADVEGIIAVMGLQLADHSGKEPIIRAIRQALLEGKQIHCRYKSPYEPEVVELRLVPIRLCLIKYAWYLIGKPENDAEPRTYRIARFESAGLLNVPAAPPRDFDIVAYFGNAWGVYRGKQSYDVRIHFAPSAAPIVTETRWHHTQGVAWRDDGSVVLTFVVDGLEEIGNWLMSWAPHAKVEAPPELRSLLVAKLTAGLQTQLDR